MHEDKMGKQIGMLNGPWALLFKVALIGFPAMLAWGTWATKNSYALETRIVKLESFMNLGPRFTQVDAESLRLKVMAEADARFIGVNMKVLERLDAIQKDIGELKIDLAKRTAHP